MVVATGFERKVVRRPAQTVQIPGFQTGYDDGAAVDRDAVARQAQQFGVVAEVMGFQQDRGSLVCGHVDGLSVAVRLPP